MTEARYYSLRRLSPYQGTVQVVELDGFRALSDDGLTWQVHLQYRGPRASVRGVWRADGSGNLIETERTKTYLTALRTMPPLPFVLADRIELWLLDAERQLPLALLAATLERDTIPPAMERRWQAALAGDDSFVAPSLHHGVATSAAPMPHREVLARCVQKAAGARPVTQWFRRSADGSGAGLSASCLAPGLAGRRLEAGDFPELLLREEWGSDTETGLVRDYHDWHAPGLLTHSHIARPTRVRLEQAACRQAKKLYHVRQLLPEMLNPDLIKVAMVEAVLRQTSAS
jgi:uncharacterized protein YbaR (Trm112 family)